MSQVWDVRCRMRPPSRPRPLLRPIALILTAQAETILNIQRTRSTITTATPNHDSTPTTAATITRPSTPRDSMRTRPLVTHEALDLTTPLITPETLPPSLTRLFTTRAIQQLDQGHVTTMRLGHVMLNAVDLVHRRTRMV